MGEVAAIIISSVIQAGVTYMGQQKAQKAAKRRAAAAAAQRRRTEALTKRREDLISARQRRRAFGEARRMRGAVVNLAAVRGAGGAIGAPGSTVPAFQANITQALNANNAFINQVTALNVGIRASEGALADIQGRPRTAGSGLIAFGGLIGDVGPSAFKFFGGGVPAGGKGTWPSWA
jgi:hypothetical protein